MKDRRLIEQIENVYQHPDEENKQLHRYLQQPVEHQTQLGFQLQTCLRDSVQPEYWSVPKYDSRRNVPAINPDQMLNRSVISNSRLIKFNLPNSPAIFTLSPNDTPSGSKLKARIPASIMPPIMIAI